MAKIYMTRSRYSGYRKDAQLRGVSIPHTYDSYKIAVAKFKGCRGSARERNIVWELTFEQWWGIWAASGKWKKRGSYKGQYVMARYNDTGPYAVGNVRIITNTANTLERKISDKARSTAAELMRALGRSRKGKPSGRKGVPFTKRHKAAISISLLGREIPQTTKDAVSASNRKRKGEKRKPQTKAQKQAKSLAALLRHAANRKEPQS
jgi:hypothetical protein